MLSPIIFLIPYVIQYYDYHKTIYEFEERCRESSLRFNTPETLCAWPGGPPQKPVLEQWFNQI